MDSGAEAGWRGAVRLGRRDAVRAVSAVRAVVQWCSEAVAWCSEASEGSGVAWCSEGSGVGAVR